MTFTVRPARTSDVWFIRELVGPLVQRRILLGKETVVFFEAIQEFRVAEDPDGIPIGCGALHVMWEDLAEVRTLAVVPEW
ncbi:MAG: N-acetylglutamate synthase, partial [Cryobacterium sp.]|nr:N-acetylglutamate synthase [Cryobacterium sp.]